MAHALPLIYTELRIRVNSRECRPYSSKNGLQCETAIERNQGFFKCKIIGGHWAGYVTHDLCIRGTFQARVNTQ